MLVLYLYAWQHEARHFSALCSWHRMFKIYGTLSVLVSSTCFMWKCFFFACNGAHPLTFLDSEFRNKYHLVILYKGKAVSHKTFTYRRQNTTWKSAYIFVTRAAFRLPISVSEQYTAIAVNLNVFPAVGTGIYEIIL